jgi:hypothetical protein
VPGPLLAAERRFRGACRAVAREDARWAATVPGPALASERLRFFGWLRFLLGVLLYPRAGIS